ncbi:discoidin domain-containing protein [Nocardioides montaniterrae]
MNYCSSCGHALGVGRFCTNCGTPVPGRHPDAAASTPAPPAAPPSPPASPSPPAPPANGLPSAPRYPLYADSPLGQIPTAPPAQPATAPVPPVLPPPPAPQPPAPAYASEPGRNRRGPLVLAALLALVVVVAAIVAVKLLSSDGSDKVADTARPKHHATARTVHTPSTRPSEINRGPGSDLTGDIDDIQVPGTATPSTDLRGRPVTFGAAHLIDGDPQTAWRIDGDAAGKSLTITFPQPVQLTSVGLINGYAKKYPGYNGYLRNRRITEVRWTFEDGSTITQDLAKTTALQTTDVHPGPTSSVKLEIVSTEATPGPNYRPFTAISELALVGSTS